MGVALLCMGFGVQAKPLTPVEVHIEPPARELAGNRLTATLSVRFDTTAHALRLGVEGRGVLARNALERRISGPWEAGTTYSLPIDAEARASGEGELVATVEVLDEKGQVRWRVRGFLFALSEEGRLWVSPSSPTDLLLHRAEALSHRTRLSAQQQEQLIAEVVTARARVDQTPRPGSSSPHGLVLERMLQSAGVPPPPAPAPGAAVSITVAGRVEWTDSNGNVHGLPRAAVEIRDSDLLGSELITTLETDAFGNYTASFTHDDGLLQGDPDIFVRVLARSPVAELKPATSDETYRLETPVQSEVANGSSLTLNLVAGNTADNETVFSVHHALVMIGGYAGSLAGTMPTRVITRFPTNRSTSMFSGGELHILRADRWDWDVIHHEYGHYFMNAHGFVNHPGGSHGYGDNLATRYGKDAGLRLAWGEGWPTYFGIWGQQATHAATLNVPNVGDTSYHDTEDATISQDLESSQGAGEDNEVSVFSALWDLTDASGDGVDEISLGDRLLFNLFRTRRPVTIGQAWEALADGRSNLERTRFGAVFGQSNIAPELVAPVDNLTLGAGDPPPTFRWEANGGGAPNPLNDFRLTFWNRDFSSQVFQRAVGNVLEYTPTAAELSTILGSGLPVHWVVEGRNTSAPQTPGGTLGWYWSNARVIGGVTHSMVIDDTGSMSEEIAGVRSALQGFIASLGGGASPPTLELITFKDNVTPRIASNDLAAVQAQVSGLFASGGGDCPEFSAQALQYAAQNIAPGGTILLATDASSQPGVDIGSLITQLRAKGVTVNTILSGDCTPISGVRTMDDWLVNSGSADQKPGSDDPPQDPLEDPGQPPIDLHGNTPELASPLRVGGGFVRGAAGGPLAGNIDFFRLRLEAGETYAIDFRLEAGSAINFSLLGTDGRTVLQSETVFDTAPHQLAFTASAAGEYFLRVRDAGSAVFAPYRLEAREDPFAGLDTAIELFSTISNLTGGVFLVRDAVNVGDARAYESALFNLLRSAVQPATIAANPEDLPRGATLTVELQGIHTNWRSSSTVSFGGGGLEVLSVDVHSATSLSALVRVDPAAALGFREVEVVTDKGGGQLERAMGRDVVEVTNALTGPVLLGVEPSTLARGASATLLVRGINTAWNATSIVSLGSGIRIDRVTVRAPTLLEVEVTAEAETAIGFRTARVTTSGTDVQSRARALFVTSGIAALPELVSLTPAEGAPGAALQVLVEARNTTFQAGVTTASFGSGIDIHGVEVLGPQTARVSLTLRPDAALGFRDVSLTTGTQIAVRLNGFLVTPATTGDTDLDGVPDARDACAGTVIPEPVPTTRLGIYRWALVDNDAVFDTTLPPGCGSLSPRTYRLEDTAGCSCAQIIEKLGLGTGHERFGCSIGVMDDWVKTHAPPSSSSK